MSEGVVPDLMMITPENSQNDVDQLVLHAHEIVTIANRQSSASIRGLDSLAKECISFINSALLDADVAATHVVLNISDPGEASDETFYDAQAGSPTSTLSDGANDDDHHVQNDEDDDMELDNVVEHDLSQYTEPIEPIETMTLHLWSNSKRAGRFRPVWCSEEIRENSWIKFAKKSANGKKWPVKHYKVVTAPDGDIFTAVALGRNGEEDSAGIPRVYNFQEIVHVEICCEVWKFVRSLTEKKEPSVGENTMVD